MKTAYIYRKPGTEKTKWYDRAIVYDIKNVQWLPYRARLITYGNGDTFYVPPGYTVTVKQRRKSF